jgi:hypothetical protein
VPRLLRLMVFGLGALILSGGCHEGVPEFPTDVLNLMARYNQSGRHDDAIRVAQNWLNKNPEDYDMRAKFDEQIAMSFFMKVPNDASQLFQVKRKKCVQKEFDRADIVRDVR